MEPSGRDGGMDWEGLRVLFNGFGEPQLLAPNAVAIYGIGGNCIIKAMSPARFAFMIFHDPGEVGNVGYIIDSTGAIGDVNVNMWCPMAW